MGAGKVLGAEGTASTKAQRLNAAALFSCGLCVPGPGWSLDCGESDKSVEDPAVSLR